jgi:hypothetical protein
MASQVNCKVCSKRTRRASGVCTVCAEAKPCDRCGKPRGNADSRYCKDCSKALKAEMTQAGYLQGVPKQCGAYRAAEQKEDIHSTKFGRD